MCVFSGPTEAALRQGDISVALAALIDDILEGNGQPADRCLPVSDPVEYRHDRFL